MEKKNIIFLSFLVILMITTLSMIFQKNSRGLIKVDRVSQNGSGTSQTKFGISSHQNEFLEVANQLDRVNNSSTRERENDRYFSQSYQEQETTINISSSDLDQPHILSISALQSKTYLATKIFLNGQLIKSFTGNHNVFNLSPYLTSGKQIVSILGDYTPNNSSVKIELTGQTTHIRQETGGSGEIRQKLIFNVN